MRRLCAIARSLGAAVVLIASAVARAQMPPATPDSTSVDTSLVKNPHMMQAALYALVLAPATLAAIMPDSAVADSLPLAADHVTYSAGGGLATGTSGPMGDPNNSLTVQLEMYRSGRLFGLRAERWLHSDRSDVHAVTFRIGDALRPRARAIGGVTLGFRWVPEVRKHQGFELAFPLILGGMRSRWRLETAYLFSLDQMAYSYRVRYERRLGDGPLTLGFNADFEDWALRKHGRLSHQMVGVILGTTRLWGSGRQ